MIKRISSILRSLTGKRHDARRLDSIPDSSKSSRHCILHVGTDKTGSTAIQSILASNPVQLEELGYFYPHSGRERLHHHGNLQQQLELGNYQGWKTLRDELIEHEGLVGIISFEGFYHLSSQNLMKIKDILHDYEIHIVIYLRRQSDMVCSGVVQRIKQGTGLVMEEYDRDSLIDMVQDYPSIISKFEDVFGRHNIALRRYEKSSFQGGNLFLDFMSATGSELSLSTFENNFTVPQCDPNPSLDVDGVYVLSLFDKVYVSDRVRGVIRDILLKNGANDKSTFIREDIATEIDRMCSKSNSIIAREWFGENKLFCEPPGFVYREPDNGTVKEHSKLIWRLIPYIDMPCWGGIKQPVLQLKNSGRLKTVRDFENCIPLSDAATEIIVRVHIRQGVELSLYIESESEGDASAYLVNVAGEQVDIHGRDGYLLINIPSHLFVHYAGLILLSIRSENKKNLNGCIKEMSYVKSSE